MITNKPFDNTKKWLIIIYLISLNVFFLTIIYWGHHPLINRCFLNVFGFYQPEAKTKLTNEETTAYHEAGHALITLLYPHNYEMSYVTIIPRGSTLGHSKHKILKNDWKNNVLVALAGTAAESLVACNNQIDKQKVGKGSGSDFSKARKILNRNSKNPKNDFNLLLKQSEDLLSLNKETLDQIAKFLTIKKILSRDELYDICQKYPLKKS
ncbi:ATP-binding protein [Candidatus Phytoplasma solani]|uniref:hypothetical protein n=1 Tax=Candidatus Phytoplasma solani TaxID=69896 RepID=UPI0032DB1E36